MIADASCWHWKITPEDTARIKAGDRETVNRVYFDNLSIFRKMAGKYCFYAGSYDFYEDCIQQIYIDMTCYDYTNAKSLYWSIRKSFRRASMLTTVPTVSLESPVTDDGDKVLGDYIGVDGFAELDEKEHARNVLSLIGEQKQLTERQRDQLTAFAFGVAAYRGLYEWEYRQAYTA